LKYLHTNELGTDIYQDECVNCGTINRGKIDKVICWKCCPIHGDIRPCKICKEVIEEDRAQKHREEVAQYKRDNPEVIRAQVARRRKNNKAAGDDYRQHLELLMTEDPACQVCRKTESLTIDHIEPLRNLAAVMS
jgi:hypothetical protein